MSTENPTQFAELALAPSILKAIDAVGYEKPSPIQAQSIPPLLAGRDLLGQAQTGTGKTAAFALPLLSRLDISLRSPQVLVLTPTRELAIQVSEAMLTYARYLKGFHILPVYGGQSIGLQLRQLKRGVHAVVGTPGRILDHLQRRTLPLDKISTVVLDEADEMLRMGFIDDVEAILNKAPNEKQIALFSATMPGRVRTIAQRYLREPAEIHIQEKTATVAATTQRYWKVNGVHKLDALTRILEVEDFEAMLVFVRTKTATLDLAEKLEARGFSSAALNGDMNQGAREKTVERLRKGSLDIVVATDVAARGLDVDRITHVVNYDMPYDTESYVHRIGRTGRAGRKGDAILFIAQREERMLRAIQKATNQVITPMELPSQSAIADRRITQFKELIAETIESQDLAFFEELVAGYGQESDIDSGKIAAALAFLAQRKRPLKIDDKRPNKPKHAEKKAKNGKAPESFRGGMQVKIEQGKQRYRIEVGRVHDAQPRHIVGAIANEAEIESRHIGQISIHETYSTVDLPSGMPKSTFNHLKTVWICGQKLRISLGSEYFEQDQRRAKTKRKAGIKKVNGGDRPRRAVGEQRSSNPP